MRVTTTYFRTLFSVFALLYPPSISEYSIHLLPMIHQFITSSEAKIMQNSFVIFFLVQCPLTLFQSNVLFYLFLLGNVCGFECKNDIPNHLNFVIIVIICFVLFLFFFVCFIFDITK